MKFELTSTYNDDGELDDYHGIIEIQNLNELLLLCKRVDEEVIIGESSSGWYLEIYNGYRE